MIRRAFLIMVMGLFLSTGARAQETTDLTFFLTFVPNVQFSPLYVAMDKGYFAEADLNLSVQYGDEPDGVNLIAADQLKFGVISGEQVLQARANGRPVVFVYEWYQHYPVGVVVPDDSGIEDVSDLAGLRVGIPGRFGASYSGLVALLSAAGMTEEDVQLEPIGFNAPEVVCVGRVDASVIYIANEPLQIQQRAAAGDCGSLQGVNVINVSDAVDMVSNGLVTNQSTVENDPELVQAVVNAFDRGLRDSINNPAEAMLISGDFVENLLADELVPVLEEEAERQREFLATNPDWEAINASRVEMRNRLAEQVDEVALVQFDVLLNSIDLWNAEQLGITDAGSWVATQDVLLTMGFIDEASDLAEAYTNNFVPAAVEE